MLKRCVSRARAIFVSIIISWFLGTKVYPLFLDNTGVETKQQQNDFDPVTDFLYVQKKP